MLTTRYQLLCHSNLGMTQVPYLRRLLPENVRREESVNTPMFKSSYAGTEQQAAPISAKVEDSLSSVPCPINSAQNSVDYFVTQSKVHNTISYAEPLSVEYMVTVMDQSYSERGS